MDGTLDFSTINEDQIKICFDLININPKNVDAWVKLTQIYLRNQILKWRKCVSIQHLNVMRNKYSNVINESILPFESWRI